jgi:type I restriction enzyme S subunit
MRALDPQSRDVECSEIREYSGGGARFRAGDTLMARITPCLENGKIARFQAPDGTTAHGSTEFIVIRGREGVTDDSFAYYLTRWDGVSGYAIGQMTGSSGRQRVPTSAFDHLLIRVPPLPEQRAIAHILGTLDDKIALNRRMSATLEEMARALFKAWFVDFEPVRAKMAGRPSASAPGELGALFPARLVPSELGEIPEGWRVGRLGDIVSRRGERIRARQATVLSAVTTGELVVSDEFFTKRVYSKSIERYLAVEEWDFAYNPSRANIGSMGMLKRPILGAVSPAYVVFRPQSAYRWYLDFLLRGNSVSRWVDLLASGSVRQSLSYSDLASIPVVVPPPSVPPAFDELWEILRKGIDAAEDESRTLADMRDVLLPRLVSGELRVGDFEELAER